MNTLVGKEARQLLPIWVTAVAVILAPALAGFGLNKSQLALMLGGGAVLAAVAALSTFGREFSNGTFSALLVLPVSRARVWWTKVAVLAAALGSLYALWWISFWICTEHWPALGRAAFDGQLTPLTTALFLLVVFSGGLWTTLAFRQVAAALWFALLLPFALMMSTEALLSRLTGREEIQNLVLVVMVVAYSLGGFLLAWRLFLRAEDAQWTGGTIALPTLSWLTNRSSASIHRRRRPLRALFQKELRLHHTMLLVTVLLLLLHLGTLSARKFLPSFSRQPIIEMVLATFWGLWLLMPVLVNATAAAEERKLGVLEAQLCQPVRWWRQWFVKIFVATVLGVSLGMIPPCLLENREHLPRFFTDYQSVSPLRFYDHWFTLGSISFGLGLLAFYASSLARNILQALGFAAAFGVCGNLVFHLLDGPEHVLGVALWRGNLGVILGAVAAFVAIFVLSARNFRHPVIGRRQWIRNVAVLIAALLLVATAATALYHRAWELFADTDPAHGPARVAQGSTTQGTLLQHDGQLSLRTAGGELLVFPRVYRTHSRSSGNFAHFSEHWSAQSFGSNWISHVSSYTETVAIRSDGTLWASESAAPRTVRSTDPIEPLAPLAQYGQDTNWQSVVRDPTFARSVLLLKTDGTLWQWRATNHVDRESIYNAAAPNRLGTQADWASLASTGERVFLTTTNGSVWGLNLIFRRHVRIPTSINTGNLRPLDPVHILEICEDVFLSDWRSLSGKSFFEIGVKNDGTLWAFGMLPWNRGQTKARLDGAADWRAVAVTFDSGLALKQDGSLWRIEFGSWNEAPRTHRLSRQNDWLAVTSTPESVCALAADGSLWAWDTSSFRGWNTFGFRSGWTEIAPSRIPTKIVSLP